jgi:hypothetical protein
MLVVSDASDHTWLPAELDLPPLGELLRRGDTDAFAGFRDAHLSAVRGYCAEACAGELVDQACDASFADFVGRLRTGGPPDDDLEQLLMQATRSAAAGRFAIAGTLRSSAGSSEPICDAVPELLAAERNGQLLHGDRQLRAHLEQCRTCADVVERAERAERAYGPPAGAPEK